MLPSLELKVPPPLVMLSTVGAMWGLSLLAPRWDAPLVPRLVVGMALAATGAAIAIAGVTEFGRARTTINPLTPAASSTLVHSGIYERTRNPMYLGMLLVLLGWAAFLASAWALLGPPVFAAYIGRFQIAPEERVLASLFGEPYAAYKQQVRRWL